MGSRAIQMSFSRRDITRWFYEWEMRGRGWLLWQDRIDIEPPFLPLDIRRDVQPIDDGRRSSGFSRWLETTFQRPTEAVRPVGMAEVEPRPLGGDVELAELRLIMPPDEVVSGVAVVQLLMSLRHVLAPISFELIGTDDSIWPQFVCRRTAQSTLLSLIGAHLGNVVVSPCENTLGSIAADSASTSCVIDFGLRAEFMLPLAVVQSFDVDPLSAIAAVLGRLSNGEVAVFQVLFQETTEPWAAEAMRAVGDGEGGAFFVDARNFENLARQKLRRPLFAVVIRLAAKASVADRAWEIVRGLGAALGVSSNPEGNSLIPLVNDGYPGEIHLGDLIQRRSRRSGMLLNVDELVTFVHPPSSSVLEERLERRVKRTRSASPIAAGRGLVIGENIHLGRAMTVSQGENQRLRHTYVIGASGTGKSTLLLNMFLQDVHTGRGCALVDPHGDLIDQVLERMPTDRIDDVVLLDASDEEYPVGLNVLQARSDSEKNLLSSDLVEAFKRLSSTWGDQMTSVLGNAILAFLESSRGGTLADLRRFLVEPDYREEFLQSVKDPHVIYYWRKEFALLTGRPQAPLLTRLDTFLRPKLVRAMVSQKYDRLDFRGMMDRKKIFLAKLTQGAIGEENSYLLGTLLVTKFHQAALGRQSLPEADRMPFFLYIDEFHNFVTPSLASILSGARKFGLGLILAHQELRQVSGQDSDVAGAVIANPFTRICFRVGDDDARRLQSGFAHFEAKDLQSLGVGEAIVRMEQAENDFTMTTLPFPPRPADGAERRARIVELSRQRFARRRSDIEQEMATSMNPTPSADKASRPPRKFGPPPRN